MTEVRPMHIWVDADACPVAIRGIITKAATRLKIRAVFLANHKVPLLPSPFVSMKIVDRGFDVADGEILTVAADFDLVVTQDVLLAAELVAKGTTAINPRGTLYSKDSMHGHLTRRNQAEAARDLGIQGRGAEPFGPKHVQAFASTFDRELTRLHQRYQRANGL